MATRIHLHGDEAKAAMLRRAAMVKLGQLKHAMSFQNLFQGIRQHSLPDGSIIQVQSVGSLDRIDILAPTYSPAQNPLDEYEIEYSGEYLYLYSFKSGETYPDVGVWDLLSQKPAIIPGFDWPYNGDTTDLETWFDDNCYDEVENSLVLTAGVETYTFTDPDSKDLIALGIRPGDFVYVNFFASTAANKKPHYQEFTPPSGGSSARFFWDITDVVVERDVDGNITSSYVTVAQMIKSHNDIAAIDGFSWVATISSNYVFPEDNNGTIVAEAATYIRTSHKQWFSNRCHSAYGEYFTAENQFYSKRDDRITDHTDPFITLSGIASPYIKFGGSYELEPYSDGAWHCGSGIGNNFPLTDDPGKSIMHIFKMTSTSNILIDRATYPTDQQLMVAWSRPEFWGSARMVNPIDIAENQTDLSDFITSILGTYYDWSFNILALKDRKYKNKYKISPDGSRQLVDRIEPGFEFIGRTPT